MENIMARRTKKPGAELAQQIIAQYKPQTVEDMENIFLLMDEDKKVRFDKAYIEELYTRYLATGKVQEEHKGELEQKLKDKTVVLVAPGRSSEEELSLPR